MLRRLQRAVGVEPLGDLDAATLTDWYAALAEAVEPESRATELSHVRQFYRWLVIEDYRPDDPTVRLIRPRIGRRTPRPIPEADLHVALVRAPERYRPWLILAAYAGLRAMEIAQLRREDVMDRQDPPVIVVVDGKGNKDRVVPMSPLVIRELYRHDLPARGRLFLTFDGRPMSAANVSVTTNRYLHAINIEASLHQLRHRFATRLYAECGDLRIVQELMGHCSPVTTAGYAAYSAAAAVQAVRAIASNEHTYQGAAAS